MNIRIISIHSVLFLAAIFFGKVHAFSVNNRCSLISGIILHISGVAGHSAVKKGVCKVARDTIGTDYLIGDSVVVQANPRYNKRGHFHRKLFGENYRKEWAIPIKVPLIKISDFQGGLTPLKQGGGMQTVSLRLVDKRGKEWVIRSVNKNTDALLPAELQKTFASDFLDDANSAQHPFSALMVPPLAHAVNVAHTHPVIGVIAADTSLGSYNKIFANTLCLIEEREPLGDSDNTAQMLAKVQADNGGTFQAEAFLRARMLDMLIGDWDRHEDQWRWYDGRKGKGKDYIPIPRDRDQAFRKVEGILPTVTSLAWVLPTLQGFRSTISRPQYSIFKSRFLNAHPASQFTHDHWTRLVDSFVRDLTDSVLEESVRQLPAAFYRERHESILSTLRQRRAALPQAMESYYRFVNTIVDIKLSDKREEVDISEGSNKGLKVTIKKIDKAGIAHSILMEKEYEASITKEIRIYLAGGNDSLLVKNASSGIKVRVIGGDGAKAYHIETAGRLVKIYDAGAGSTFTGTSSNFRKYLSSDSAHTRFVPVNLYNVWMPLITGGYNADDGLMIGGGFRYTQQEGFRKQPFAHQQELLVAGSFATGAFKIKYKGQWKEAVGKADLIADVRVHAPGNTLNFFGLGNNTVYDKKDNQIRYYRTRFNLYDVRGALQWSLGDNSTVSIGPSFQFYNFDSGDNEGRFINNTNQLGTYDSLTIARNKLFGGFDASFIKDSRNNKILATAGGYLKLDIQGLTGLNDYSKSFLQSKAEVAIYKSIAQETITLANRVGAGTTFGKTTFYQSLFLGGQSNLWGYRQDRFAGKHLFYNNFEARIKLAQVGSYIIPGQLGLLGFYDIGKVWADGTDDNGIHQGTGSGIYYAPARMTLLQIVAGHSKEGWYPYFTMGFRF